MNYSTIVKVVDSLSPILYVPTFETSPKPQMSENKKKEFPDSDFKEQWEVKLLFYFS